MNNLIVHISDLHVADHTGKFGRINKKSYLTSGTGDENYNYINHFLDRIKEFGAGKKFLVITGDITDIAENVEFEKAIQNVHQIMEGLGVSKDEILLIPGDHDVHRDTIKNEYRKNRAEQNDKEAVKYNNFKSFYKEIKGKDFSHESIIFDSIEIAEIILLGVNSNFDVDQNGGHGFLQTEKFSMELKAIRDTHPEKELILYLHHNLEGEHEDSYFGQWNHENKKDLISIFERYVVKCIFYGNEHTHNSKNLAGSDIIVSDSGAFSSREDIPASFKIYDIDNQDGGLKLTNNVFVLLKANAVRESNFGEWIQLPASDIKKLELKEFTLRKVALPTSVTITDLPTAEDLTQIKLQEFPNEVVLQPNMIYMNKVIQNQLYKIVKDKKLFHQGHFHWSETSRAHNWIDIGRLLEDKEDLYFVENAIIDVIETMGLMEGTDLIIGLGYEGNIISSKASVKYNIPYSFLPYSYRWRDHHEFENTLNFSNEDEKYKQVLLITDVVNDGRTIRKLVGKATREKAFFDNVDRIIVVSLFYTGHQKVNYNILNYDSLPPELQLGDEEVNKIDYYTIQQLKVEKCPYGEDYKTECFILRDNLHCVHKFYTEH